MLLSITKRTTSTRSLPERGGLFGVISLVFAIVLALIPPDALGDASGYSQSSLLQVRSIQIEVRDVFDKPDDHLLFELANSLKASTREWVIRQELLFREGDVYDEFLIQESERNLRGLNFLRQATIVPLFDGNSVDIIVTVQDTWTLFPQFSFASGTGTNKTSIGLADSNLFGLGKRLEVLLADDEGREKIEFVWRDRRFFGRRRNFDLGVFKRTDGYKVEANFGRPFRSLKDPLSWAIGGSSTDLVDKLYYAGKERYIYRNRHHDFDIGATRSWEKADQQFERLSLGYSFDSSSFKQADAKDYSDVDVDPNEIDQDPRLLPQDRTFSGPYVAWQYLEADYISLNYLNRFERIEDFSLGRDFFAKLGIAGELLGSDYDALLADVSCIDGYKFAGREFVRGELFSRVRYSRHGFEQSLTGGQAGYYNVFGPQFISGVYVGRYAFVLGSLFDVGYNTDRDFEYLLGASNGLRGYEDRTFSGDYRALVSAEGRVHFIDELWQILSVGGAVFADIGGVSEDSMSSLLVRELHSDIGVGLRVGFPRTSGGSVLRIDLAFPTRSGPDGSDAFEPRLIITTGQLFTPRLPREERVKAGGTSLVFVP